MSWGPENGFLENINLRLSFKVKIDTWVPTKKTEKIDFKNLS